MACCRELATSAPCESPFVRTVCYGWYDGPTLGIMECACGATWRFRLLAELAEEDGGRDLRVYELSPLPAGVIQSVVEAMDPWEEPRWPVWVPLVRDAIREAVAGKLDAAISNAGAPEQIIGCVGYERVYASKAPPKSPPSDWMEYVGYPPE